MDIPGMGNFGIGYLLAAKTIFWLIGTGITVQF